VENAHPPADPASASASPGTELAALLDRWGRTVTDEQLLAMRRELDRRLGLGASSEVARAVSFPPRAILTVVGVLLAVLLGLKLAVTAQAGLTLVAIALFLALALNPPTEFFQRRGLRRHWAVLAVVTVALVVLSLLLLVLVPPLVVQVRGLISNAPRYAATLSSGHGPAGLLERRYHVVEQLEAATSGQGLSTVSGAALSGLTVVKGVVSSVISLLLVAFLTLFMLLEGPTWRQRFTELVPPRHGDRVQRIGSGIYRVVAGFVTGNLLASALAGVGVTVLLLVVGVPYALPLGLLTLVLELVPYVGPVVVTTLLSLVTLTRGLVPALVLLGVLVGYHLIEGHTLRPLIYGRALKLSPLAVLISILLGTEIAGILGSLLALPVAGAVQVLLAELLRERRAGRARQEPASAPYPRAYVIADIDVADREGFEG